MSKPEKGALILTHMQNEGSCMLGRTLDERGYRMRTVNTPSVDLDDIDPLRPDIMIVMGGPIGVYQANDYPFLNQEIDIIKARLDADKPTIGVCLGSQIIAAAMGARVYKGPQKELGWLPIHVTEAGQKTPVRHLDRKMTNMFHWHGDTFLLPKDATLLASSDAYENQIFQAGENTLGIQCHPEVTANMLQEWFVMFHRDVTGDSAIMPIDDLREATEQYGPALKAQTTLFFNEWLDERGL